MSAPDAAHHFGGFGGLIGQSAQLRVFGKFAWCGDVICGGLFGDCGGLVRVWRGHIGGFALRKSETAIDGDVDHTTHDLISDHVDEVVQIHGFDPFICGWA